MPWLCLLTEGWHSCLCTTASFNNFLREAHVSSTSARQVTDRPGRACSPFGGSPFDALHHWAANVHRAHVLGAVWFQIKEQQCITCFVHMLCLVGFVHMLFSVAEP